MAEKIITGTLRVGFSQADDELGAGNIIIEIDDRPDGLNNGKTTFRPGDPVHYLVYLPPNATITEHIVTSGSKTAAGSGNRQIEDESVQFAFSDSASLRYYAASGLNTQWQGQALGNPALQDDRRTLIVPNEGLAILSTNYAAAYSAYRLSGVSLDVLAVLIGIKAKITV